MTLTFPCGCAVEDWRLVRHCTDACSLPLKLADYRKLCDRKEER